MEDGDFFNSSDTGTYMREIARTPLLTREQELELNDRVKRGDEGARDQFIRANLRLVAKIARQYAALGVLSYEDLIQAGNVGLMSAVEKYDARHEAGAKFSSYAAWWIRQSIYREMANTGRNIRLPVHVVDKVLKLRKVERALTEELGREPTDGELAEAMGRGATVEKIELWRASYQGTVSLDMPTTDDEGTTLGSVIPDPRSHEAGEEAERTEEGALMASFLPHLDARARDILERRYGLGDREVETLEEVAVTYGVTRERIHQLQNKALRELAELRRLHELKTPEQIAEEARIEQAARPAPRRRRRFTTQEERDEARRQYQRDYIKTRRARSSTPRVTVVGLPYLRPGSLSPDAALERKRDYARRYYHRTKRLKGPPRDPAAAAERRRQRAAEGRMARQGLHDNYVARLLRKAGREVTPEAIVAHRAHLVDMREAGERSAAEALLRKYQVLLRTATAHRLGIIAKDATIEQIEQERHFILRDIAAVPIK